MNNRKVLRSTGIGFVLLLVSLIITGLVGISDLINSGTAELYGRPFNYGFANSLTNFWLIWRPGKFVHETAYISQVLFFIAIFLTLGLIIMAFAKKKPLCVLPALVLGASIAYLPFLLILVVPMAQLGVLRAAAMGLLSGVTGLVMFAIFFEVLAVSDLLKDSLALLKKAGGDEDEEEEEKPVEKKEEQPVVAGLSEEEVRKIVEESLEQHVEEKHVPGAAVVVDEEPEEEPQPEPVPEEEPAPAPVEEEQPEEEQPEEEPEDEEEEEEEEEESAPETPDNAPAGIGGSKGKRRRASFETRLKNSEFDLRHKYYDLRDYIKWYGLRNRISIPGDTFSYKRQRYVFVTIVGKHIRVYLNLDPQAYADSTIPVEPAAAKKYEDLPCLLRVKSDLSYRRAKKLVDDLMAKIGLEKPDEDEPKETQNKD